VRGGARVSGIWPVDQACCVHPVGLTPDDENWPNAGLIHGNGHVAIWE
jgi:hypothetical protein